MREKYQERSFSTVITAFYFGGLIMVLLQRSGKRLYFISPSIMFRVAKLACSEISAKTQDHYGFCFLSWVNSFRCVFQDSVSFSHLYWEKVKWREGRSKKTVRFFLPLKKLRQKSNLTISSNISLAKCIPKVSAQQRSWEIFL